MTTAYAHPQAGAVEEELAHRRRGPIDGPDCTICDGTGQRDEDRLCDCRLPSLTRTHAATASPSAGLEVAAADAPPVRHSGGKRGDAPAGLKGPAGSAPLGGRGADHERSA